MYLHPIKQLYIFQRMLHLLLQVYEVVREDIIKI